MFPVISRAEAKAAGKTKYFTGKPCPKGHVAERWVASYTCAECQLLDDHWRRAANIHGRRDKVNATAKAAYYADLEASRANRRAYSKRVYEQRKPYHAAWIAANRERWNEYVRARNATLSEDGLEKRRVNVRNRRARLRKAAGKHTATQIRDLLAKQRHKCVECRNSLKSGYHVDHIMPLKLGGSNDISNIQLLCQPCNDRKAYSDPLVWARKRGRLL